MYCDVAHGHYAVMSALQKYDMMNRMIDKLPYARIGVKDKLNVHAVHDPIPLCP